MAYLLEALAPQARHPSAAGTPRLAIPAVDGVVLGKKEQMSRHHRSLNGQDIVTSLKKNHEKRLPMPALSPALCMGTSLSTMKKDIILVIHPDGQS